jgi:hypothetical protein
MFDRYWIMGSRATLLAYSLLFFLPILLMGSESALGMKEMISIENLKQHIRNIQFDRNPYDRYDELEQAAHYIREEFLKIGMEVKEDLFQWQGRFYKNIVAKKKGDDLSG